MLIVETTTTTKMAAMNLRDVALLLTNKNREYETAHSRVVRVLGLDTDETSLNTYLDMIYNDPAEWLSLCTPDNTKPKSALFFLLERCPNVRAAIGEERCNIVANAVRGEWKTIRKQNKAAIAAAAAANTAGANASKTYNEGDDNDDEISKKNEQLSKYIDAVHELIDHLTFECDEKLWKTLKVCLPAMAKGYGIQNVYDPHASDNGSKCDL